MSSHTNVLPLMMTHRWPGSVIELHDSIGPLTDPTAHGGSGDDVFRLVLPSAALGAPGDPVLLQNGRDLADAAQLGRGERNAIRSGGVTDDESQTRSDEEARGVAHFQVVEQLDGRYHWQLFNPYGTPAVRSSESYATEDEAVAAVEQARRLIGQAPINRPVRR